MERLAGNTFNKINESKYLVDRPMSKSDWSKSVQMNKFLKIFKKVVLYTFSVLLLLSAAGYTYLYVLPKGPEITVANKLMKE